LIILELLKIINSNNINSNKINSNKINSNNKNLAFLVKKVYDVIKFHKEELL
jgi:hypothetical protein